MVEVNSETDFVAKNELFQEFVRNVAKLVLEHGTDVDALGNAAYPTGGTVSEALTENIAKIEDKGVQQAFSSLCLRRGGDFKPSPKREW